MTHVLLNAYLILIQKTSQGRDDVSILLPSLSRQMYISEDPRPVNVKLTGEVILPLSSVVLPPRDDAAEYDDSGDTYHFQDDPKYVVRVICGKVPEIQSLFAGLHVAILRIHGRISVATIIGHISLWSSQFLELIIAVIF
jgi:hypothetical protein